MKTYGKNGLYIGKAERAVLRAVLFFTLIFSAIPAAAGDIMLKFMPGTDMRTQKTLIAKSSAVTAGYVEEIGLWRLRAPADKSNEEITAFFKNRADVKYCYTSRKRRAFFTPDDLSYGSQWGLTAANGINMENAWDIPESSGSAYIIIAVIDTGVDYTHPDLKNKMWKSPQGFYGHDFANSDNDPIDDNGHGTHVSGIAAAEVNNAAGIAGVSRNSKVMALKVLDSSGSGSEADEVSAIIWAVKNGARVINMSFGASQYAAAEADACEWANEKGVFIAAASGNDNSTVAYPAKLSTTFAVGAVNESGSRCSPSDWGAGYGSNYGSELDVVAPGNNILSTVPDSNPGGSDIWDPSGYKPESGTSMATPFIAGLASIILSFRPDYSASAVAGAIRSASSNYPARTDEYGWGLVDAQKCLAALTEYEYSPSAQAVTSFPNPYRSDEGVLHFCFKPDASEIKNFIIFDFTGIKVVSLDNGSFFPDKDILTWDGRNGFGRSVASGIYFYYAETDKGSSKGRFAVIK